MVLVRGSFVRSAGILALASGFALLPCGLQAQVVTGNTTQTTDAQGKPQTSVSVTMSSKDKKKTDKTDRVQQSKDTKKDVKQEDKDNPLIAKDETLPDKQLYDKALDQDKKGHFDVARLDLQTLLNTYPDSQYQMRAKLAVADSWYREGGAAALAQASQEYNDFITFFPNAPEAAEAQMRIGDIYFKQMDVPDRDYVNQMKAEAAYRTMLKQYPDAPPDILKEAKQKLREVQEVEATRQATIGTYYMGRENWPAAIARYQTVVDTYPLYSHMDEVLIAIGDAYESEARMARNQVVCVTGATAPCIAEGAKAKLEEDFDGKAAAEYRMVVLQHSAAPHVEDAKERLMAMNLPVPTPTADEVAASEALEGSRAQYSMKSRLELLVLHKPDTVTAAQIGDPPLEDAPATTAPMIMNDLTADYRAALNPAAAAPKPVLPAPAAEAAPAAPAAPVASAPLSFNDVGTGSTAGSTTEMTPAGDAGAPSTGVGAAVISTGGTTVPASTLPAATGAPDPNYGLPTAQPKDNTPLPAADKPAEAADQVNEAAGKQEVPADTSKAPKNGKAADYDKSDESSSKHEPKKGVDKLNPF